MNRRQKEECNSKVLATLRQVGASFPEDDYDDSTSSGTDTGVTGHSRRSCHRRQVKSGAKIKKRPVIKTELWPHTVANEDDGEEVTGENIHLAFFSPALLL